MLRPTMAYPGPASDHIDMSKAIPSGAQAEQSVAVHVVSRPSPFRKEDLPIVLLVIVDLLTFASVVATAGIVDRLLEQIRGPSSYFAVIRLIADVFLGFLAIVYVVEGVTCAAIEAADVVRSRLGRLRKRK